jgi:HK97 family phage major capsid protein
MNRYKALLDERAQLVAEGKAIFETAEREARDLTEAEKSRDDAINARLETLAGELEREERRRERERTAPAVPAGAQAARIEVGHDRGADKPWGADTGAPFGEFLQAVHRAHTGLGADPRLFQAAAQGAGEKVGADGGFLVQQTQADGLLQKMHDVGQILPLISPVPLGANSNGIKINAVKETSRATGSRFGGVQGYWVDEGVAPTASRPKFRKVALELKKLAALGYATDELLADAIALESVMTRAFAEELTFLTEDAIINGLGAGMPLGILNAGCLVTQNKEGSQTNTTVVGNNLSNMWARLPARSKANAVWLINVDVEPQLDQLVFPVGATSIEARFITYGPDGILRIKGRPVMPVEYCATLGTVGDIILADFAEYAFIQKSVQQASSIHVAFTTDEMAFRATYRVDGQPTWESALTPFKGTNTLSPFVALQAR